MELVRLLNCLADGQYHSGVEIGLELGVSRTAVWKALGKLEASGVALEVVKGKGYRIVGGLDLLSRDAIVGHLNQSSTPFERLYLLQDVDSTNSFLMREESGSDGYALCLSERQSSGRGRRGRVWHSPYAKNLYLSLSFNLAGGAEALEGLSLALGVAVANCLSANGVADIGLKWPNDIWVGDKKLAGLLVELKGEAELGWKVVAGLGINVLMSEDEGSVVDQPWTSISAVASDLSIDRSLWASLLIESLITTIERYRLCGLEGLLAEWSRFDILHGRGVQVSGSGLSGLCMGVDGRGRLLVKSGEELHAINAGEVSVRPNKSSD
ncbi:biotin--[acetyl-CoA-carboxylase] ligase [Alkalimarinus coralli]|uniref:biotin--[acetyl-CoA-carboxylase] ligase n=1 Tax=Alkalimarinus coralli TaxID=2935863 RepID=UPI00202B0195|nr:biotin--[acetyl-CoA-carboxylase] ligase [Alkalimarinus coralli]